MWIDMFPIYDNNLDKLPKPVDVSKRKPKKYQLRVIIINTKDVILDDINPITGERKSDIYIKGFMCDKENESVKTDVHYRSLNGEGNFNWRFKFNFEYIPTEKRIVYQHQEKFGFVNTEKSVNLY